MKADEKGIETDVDIPSRLQAISLAWSQSRFAEALGLIEQLPAQAREDFQVMAHEADLHGRLGDHEREIDLLGILIARQPAMASLWLSKGQALKTIGRTAEAIEAYRKAIQIRPAYGRAWWTLSDLKSYRFADQDIAEMIEALDSGPDPDDRLHLHFALGKAFEDRGDPAAAFEHYRQGNALRAATIPPGAKIVAPRVDRAIETFTPEFYTRRAGQGYASDAPIFIVGLQRSGSTLVEQILGSHPEVEATSELPLIPHLFREIAQDPSLSAHDPIDRIAELDADRLAVLGEAYVERASAFRSTDRPHFTDKLPANWLNIGLIRLILPNAKIIDARRHPMAASFSNFRQLYGSGANWTYDLSTIGNYYRDYLRLMAHFDRVQPGAIHRIVNERLIGDLEGEVRRLLDFLGLPFDPACLESHRSGRAVRTPSSEQVRRPVSREGIDQWRAFEPWLGELKAALGPALKDWDA